LRGNFGGINREYSKDFSTIPTRPVEKYLEYSGYEINLEQRGIAFEGIGWEFIDKTKKW